ncbi:MAG: DUF4349 domain-containing protein [Peptostreptococcaceae bacterium]|nr:DUF4349 domain-containing protein [Peptostreptococcaceae bacterium]
MNCEFDKTKINAYIDGELSVEEIGAAEEHIKSCPECKVLYEELKNVRERLSNAEELELPDGYEEEMHQKLLGLHDLNRVKGKSTGKGKKNYNWKRWTAFAAIFLVGFVSYNVWKPSGFQMKSAQNDMAVAVESAEAPRAMNSDSGMSQDKEMSVTMREEDGTGSPGDMLNIDGRKIIRNGYVNLEVDSFEQIYDEIIALTETSGGFIQDSNTGKQYYGGPGNETTLLRGSLNIRIPEKSFLTVYNQIKELGEVNDSSISGSDITFQYNDISSQIANLEVQEARLRDIMEKAENVEELLQVERELNRVRTEIDRMTGMIKNWDNLVSYSTINVSLTEIAPNSTEIEGFENDFWEKAKREFVKSVNQVIILSQNLFVWIISIIPFIFILGLLAIIVAFIVKKKRKRKI